MPELLQQIWNLGFSHPLVIGHITVKLCHVLRVHGLRLPGKLVIVLPFVEMPFDLCVLFMPIPVQRQQGFARVLARLFAIAARKAIP